MSLSWGSSVIPNEAKRSEESVSLINKLVDRFFAPLEMTGKFLNLMILTSK